MNDPIRILELQGHGCLLADGVAYPCTIGRGGIRMDKQEGDLATPVGRFPLRGCYYRPDRLEKPRTSLPVTALTPAMGWCDDPASADYNRPVDLPFPARTEKLWREDHVYDLVIPLGYNDDPVVKGKGSAIFLHLMGEDGGGTEGCIALKKADLLALLPRLSPQTVLIVPPPT